VAGLPAVRWVGLPAIFLEGLPAVFLVRRPFYPLVVWRNGLGKVAAVKSNPHQSSPVMLTKPFIYYSPERLTGLTKVKQRLDPIKHKFIQKLYDPFL